MEPDDEQLKLLRQAVGGDVQALESLLQSVYPRLLSYVIRHLPRELTGTIEPVDVVQDCYFEACRLIAGFRAGGDDCLYRWLVTIARNRLTDMLRLHRSKRKDGYEIVGFLEQLAVYRRTPSRSAAGHEFMAAVERSIERLPLDYRQAVQLRHFEGLSVADTAQRMCRSPEAVYQLCFRALRAIRDDLQSASQFI